MHEFEVLVGNGTGRTCTFAVNASGFVAALDSLNTWASVYGYTLVGDVELAK